VTYAAVRPISTRFADNDAFGHVNNAVYYAYFDTAINGWIQDLTGVPTWELPALGVVAASSCDFHAEVHFPQQLWVGLRVVRLGVKSVTYELGLWADGDVADAVRATGRWVHVYVDPVTRASVPVPAALRIAFERLSTPEPTSRCASPT
jgi:acyl-CoA thioester hydrolase